MTTVTNARGVLLSYSAASLHHFSATSAGPLLEGTDEADSFWGDSSVVTTLSGGLGDDIYHLYSRSNAVVEAADGGIDSIETWMDYRLPEHFENLTVTGNGRQAVGNALDNIITGGNGTQTLDGAGGDDVLIGGAGADIFAVSAGNGSDLIADFSAEDSLRLTGFGFSSFDRILANLTQQGGDAVLDLGDGEILVFADTDIGDLNADQFALEIDTSAWTLSFEDGFDSLDLRNGEGGTWETNFWWADPSGSSLEGEDQWYIDTDYAPTAGVTPFSVKDGILTITAAPADPDIQAAIGGYAYTSGMLTSYSSFAQTYGYFEIRADMPEDYGTWPAFWLLPADGSWPPELDVIEKIGEQPDRLILTSHTAEAGEHLVETLYADIADSAGFHSYGVLWGPEEISWTYDGVVVATTETPADMHGPMYMVVNLALGGIAGTPGVDLEDGAELLIDYIRVYELEDAPVVVLPNAGDDKILGTMDADTIAGGAGNDTIEGKAGDDRLFGEAGDDVLYGNAGTDYFDGGSGSDTVDFRHASLGWRVDLAAGEAQRADGTAPETLVSIENVTGGRGADTLVGDDGANVLIGREGNDMLIGGPGDDLLNGGGGDCYVFTRLDLAGGDGDDSIAGFDSARDLLRFADVIDTDDDGDRDLDDLLAAVSGVSDGGAGGDVTVAFGNGASITFIGSGSGSVDALTDLVDDAARQIQVV